MAHMGSFPFPFLLHFALLCLSGVGSRLHVWTRLFWDCDFVTAAQALGCKRKASFLGSRAL